MAMGKAVIATPYGGQSQFMTNANSYPINYTLSELPSYTPYSALDAAPGQRWAHPSVDHTAALLSRQLQRIRRNLELNVSLREPAAPPLPPDPLRAAELRVEAREEADRKRILDYNDAHPDNPRCNCCLRHGVDKTNVRSVLHCRPPPRPEAYLQEAGRAATINFSGELNLLTRAPGLRF
jgi:hypothetical protein